jgi:hypothetical protein
MFRKIDQKNQEKETKVVGKRNFHFFAITHITYFKKFISWSIFKQIKLTWKVQLRFGKRELSQQTFKQQAFSEGGSTGCFSKFERSKHVSPHRTLPRLMDMFLFVCLRSMHICNAYRLVRIPISDTYK